MEEEVVEVSHSRIAIQFDQNLTLNLGYGGGGQHYGGGGQSYGGGGRSGGGGYDQGGQGGGGGGW